MASTISFDRSLDHVLRLPSHSKRMYISELSASFVRPKITDRSQLGIGFQPSHLSVICGRGKDSHTHTGNRHFKILAGTFVEKYSRADSKTAKMAIVFNIVTMIRQAGGHFCKYMFEKGAWYEVGDRCARGKVSSLLRDMLRTEHKTSTEAKIIQGKARNGNATQFQKFGQQLVGGSSTEQRNESSMVSSYSERSKDSLGFDYSLDIDYHLLDGTEHSDDASISSSCSRISTDSLGFESALEIEFFDIDVF
jgi:hypothetical protein